MVLERSLMTFYINLYKKIKFIYVWKVMHQLCSNKALSSRKRDNFSFSNLFLAKFFIELFLVWYLPIEEIELEYL